MSRPYKPLAFGNAFIGKAFQTGIEHMKVQKLTYLAYGWWLAFHDEPVINEQPQVWKLGPVFSSMYFALNHFGSRPIQSLQKDVPFSSPPTIGADDSECSELVDWIWDRYGMHGSFYLSDLTHKPDSPWYNVAAKHNFSVPRNEPIPVEIIKEHYRKLAVQYGFAPS